MKKFLVLVLASIAVLALAGCGKGKERVAGKVYTYEKEGFGSSFTITVEKNGSFSYYEGMLSSYKGSGKWSVSGDVLTLTDTGIEPAIINRFLIDGDHLVYLAENSKNFLYVTVEDGDVFLGAPISSQQTNAA